MKTWSRHYITPGTALQNKSNLILQRHMYLFTPCHLQSHTDSCLYSLNFRSTVELFQALYSGVLTRRAFSLLDLLKLMGKPLTIKLISGCFRKICIFLFVFLNRDHTVVQEVRYRTTQQIDYIKVFSLTVLA